MLKNYISKLVCFAALSAFLLQPQWLEGYSTSKTQQSQEVNFSKANKVCNYVFDQNDENESEDSEFILADLPPTISLPVLAFTENISTSFNSHKKDLHRLQERPIWLTCRKIIL